MNFGSLNEFMYDFPEKSYCVDVCFVIDGTSGTAGFRDTVRIAAQSFLKRLVETMEVGEKRIDELRAKLIVYREFSHDGAEALTESAFFDLPVQGEEFCRCMDRVAVGSAGDGRGNALEALAAAMRSEWTAGGVRRRHIIVLFANSDVHRLQNPECAVSPFYPENMPGNVAELSEMWDGEYPSASMPDQRAKRLVLYVPDESPWHDMLAWDHTFVKLFRTRHEFGDIQAEIEDLFTVRAV